MVWRSSLSSPKTLIRGPEGKEGVAGPTYSIAVSPQPPSHSLPSFWHLVSCPKFPVFLHFQLPRGHPDLFSLECPPKITKLSLYFFHHYSWSQTQAPWRKLSQISRRKHIIELIYTNALLFLSKKQLSRIIWAGVSSLNVISGMLLQITIPWNTSLGLKLTVMVAQ